MRVRTIVARTSVCVFVFLGSIAVGYALFAHDGKGRGAEWPQMGELSHGSIAKLHYRPAEKGDRGKAQREGTSATTVPDEVEPPVPSPEEEVETSPTPQPQTSPSPTPTPPPEKEEPVHEE